MGRVVLVTGGSKGIGRSIALAFAEPGTLVAVNYRNDERGAVQVVAELSKRGAEGLAVHADVTDLAQVQSMVETVLSGRTRIDVLVNNAGETADSLFVLMSFEEWRSVLDTSLQGFFNVTKPVLKRMISKRRGCIVTLSSVSARFGHRGQTNYSAAKAGLEGACRSLASEVARLGIRVNVVAPGLIETGMIQGFPVEMIKQIIPMGRIGLPEEVARVVRFLCSDDASYISGQVIGVNGGMI